MSNRIVSKCHVCGSSITMDSIYSSDIPRLVKADQDFKASHKNCVPTRVEPNTVVKLTDEQIETLINKYLDRAPRRKFWEWVKNL